MFNPHDCREIEEEIELVNQTSTMTTEEMIECYMYGWMIIHFHTAGYSQIYAKYCRNRNNITYRQFYDYLFEQLQKENFFQEHFNQIRSIVERYLQTGEITTSLIKSGHNIHSLSFEFLYNHKHQAYQLSRSAAENFCSLEPGIVTFQNNFVFDSNQTFPVTVHLEFDLFSWQNSAHIYNIVPRISTDQEFDFYRYRRQGLLKNKFTAKENS
jgi:hypothetical protein